ncbi:MAG: homoserine dehydrogenase [Planctomycetota bacterium]
MSESTLKVGMIGFGTVGRGVAELLRDEADLYADRVGQSIELVKVLVRDVGKATAHGAIEASLVTDDVDAFFSAGTDVVVAVAGGLDPVGGFVARALRDGKDIVTANKSLLAARGPELFALAREHGASIAFEASCGGGIPCVTALTAGLMANRISGLYGILNGTCNYILTQMTRHGECYRDALAGAKDKGYAEADESLDVSGADSAQKLAILASLAFGANITEADIPCRGIDTLSLGDVRFGDELGYDIKLIASAERWEGQPYIALSTAPCFIAKDEQLAQVHGSFNALAVGGHAVGPTLFTGRGAGQMPTASAVVGDLLNVVSGAYPQGFAQMRLTPDLHGPAPLVEPDDLESRWYLRVDALNLPGVMAKLTAALGRRDISLSALLQHDAPHGQSDDTVPVVITTHQARLGDVRAAADEIAALPEINGKPVIIRILDLPG